MSEFPLSNLDSAPTSCCLPTAPRDAKPATQCVATAIDAAAPRAENLDLGWLTLPGGEFWMGEDRPHIARLADGEGPVRRVEVAPFALGRTAVTNAQWAIFVAATGYVDDATQFGWSYVFHRHVSGELRKKSRGVADGAPWWLGIEGADWQHPEGPGSNLKKRQNHPAVHISWRDAQAFCDWAGGRFPRETEWEYAARGGLERQIFPWGDELVPKNKRGQSEHRMNVWQGKFPDLDTGADGFTATAPAQHYAPNGFGFYQMTGNVWQWCAEWFAPGESRVLRGGSFLCHASYCNRYRCAARTGNSPDSTSSHGGFRIARDV